MTQLVSQRSKNDCFLCCIVMALGITYEAAAEKWGAEFVAMVGDRGLYGQADICRAFAALGLEMNRDFKSMLGAASGLPPEFTIPAAKLKALLWGRRALVQVKSKNYAGQSHITYWDGGLLFDPSPLKTYTWDEVEAEHIWIFREQKNESLSNRAETSDMTEAQIKYMVDRFLGWRLPENFSPDGGISFKRMFNEHTAHPMKHEPVGTNLLDVGQADALVRYMLEGLPESKIAADPDIETEAGPSTGGA